VFDAFRYIEPVKRAYRIGVVRQDLGASTTGRAKENCESIGGRLFETLDK